MKTPCAVLLLGMVIVAASPARTVFAEESMAGMERLASSSPKPFVLVEATGKSSKTVGQGVLVSTSGHVLSAGHVAWIQNEGRFTDKFRASMRSSGDGVPEGFIHTHKTVFSDREGKTFLEHSFDAALLKQKGSRFIGNGDLSLFQIKTKGQTPSVEFFSKDKPSLEAGERLYLCHYCFPHQPADPTFLVNPVKVVGVAQTSSGLQYLAEGYYRVGSSGGALLKDGRLIGIQSAAYTVNAKEIGEVPAGLLSFQLVWKDLFEGLLPDPQAPVDK